MISLFARSFLSPPVLAQQDTLAYRIALIAGAIIMVIIVVLVIRKLFKE
jgi:hypothetical protein